MAKSLVIAAAILLAAPYSSSAATVRPLRIDGEPAVEFKAAQGETNHLRILRVRFSPTFTDTRNPVVARGRCEQVDVHTVRCPFAVSNVLARLGDRSDRAKVGPAMVSVGGGR